MTISVFNSLIFLIAFLQEKIFNGFKILNDELLFDTLLLYWDLPGKKILGMRSEEILSLFYDHITFKKNEYGWDFKENLSFYKSKILGFDLLNPINGKVIVSKGTKVNQKLINDIKKKNISRICLEESSLIGFYLASDIIDEKMGSNILAGDLLDDWEFTI